MSAHKNKGVVTAEGSGVIVGSGKARHRFGTRPRILLLIVTSLLVIIGGIAIAYGHFHKTTVPSAKLTKAQQLHVDITAPESRADPDKLKADSDALIKGAQSGTYNVSNQDLAQAYIAHGDTEVNTQAYAAALADYQKAVQLDSSQKMTVLYNEFLANYRLGNTKAAIDCLQQLADSLKGNFDDFKQSDRATYLQYIKDMQNNQELPL